MAAIIGKTFEIITCNSVPTPRWMQSGVPQDWKGMEELLERSGQGHVLTPPPPPERRDAFLQQLQSVDIPGLPKMLEASLAGAEERAKKCARRAARPHPWACCPLRLRSSIPRASFTR